MNSQPDTLHRRSFLLSAARVAAAGFFALELPLAGCTRDDRTISNLQNLTAAEARSLAAFANQILPSVNGLPGAEQMNAVAFVDRAMTMPAFAASTAVLRTGLEHLDLRAAEEGARSGFASLSSAKQLEVMQGIERTPFFVTARSLVLTGAFANPSYGGNRDRRGWALLGIDHRPNYAAPFGWYDTQTASKLVAAGK